MKYLLPLTLALATLTACKAPVAPLTDAAIADVGPFVQAPGLVQGQGKVLSVVPADGVADVTLAMNVHAFIPPGFRVQALPEAWDEATVTLHSPTVNGRFNAGVHRLTHEAVEFEEKGGDYVALPFLDTLPGNPEFIAVAPSGETRLVTTDTSFYTVENGAARKIEQWDNLPQVLAYDRDNRLLAGFQGLPLFNLGGTLLSNAPTTYAGLAFDQDNNIYVLTNDAPRRLFKLDPTGAPLKFRSPDLEMTAIAADAQGQLYVATGTSIYAVEDDGNQALVTSELEDITAMVAGPNGHLFVAQADGTIWTCTPSGTVTRVAEAFGQISSLAVSGSDLLVADSRLNQLVRLQATPLVYKKQFKFPPLRPGNDYQARVFLKSRNGNELRLTGSDAPLPFALKPGKNNLEFTVTVNGEAMRYDLISSRAGNTVEGNTITVGDFVTLATGMAARQPGVDHLQLYLAGDCYDFDGLDPAGEPMALIGLLDKQAGWDSFRWNTEADFQAEDDQQVPDRLLFQAARFRGLLPAKTDANQFPTRSGEVVVRAFDPHKKLIGQVRIPINVLARPEVTVILK